MTPPARLDERLASVAMGSLVLAALLAAGVVVAEWIFRQIAGRNVMHVWLEPAAVLLAMSGFLSLVFIVPRAGAGRAAGGAVLLAVLVLAAALIGQQLAVDVDAARLAFHPWFSLQVPLFIATFALVLAGAKAIVALRVGQQPTAAPARSGDLRLPGWPPFSLSWLPAAGIAGSVVVIALIGGDDWYIAVPQFAWNVLAGSDFGALALTCIAVALAVEAAATGGPDTPTPGAMIVGSVVPGGFVLYLLALVLGVRLAEAWAAALVPMLVVAVPWVFARLGAGGRSRASAAVLAPVMATVLVALVLLGYARPVEAAALGVPAAVALLACNAGRSPASAFRQAAVVAAHALGHASLWVLAGVLLFAASGLAGWQLAVAEAVAEANAALAGGLCLAVLIVLGRWLPAPGAVLAGLPVAWPVLTSVGYSAAWVVVFLALASGLSSAIGREAEPAGWRSMVIWAAGLLAALLLLAEPDSMLAFSRHSRFW